MHWILVLRNTVRGFSEDAAAEMAAAMTYFAVFSLFPLLLLMVAVGSLAFDSAAAQAYVVNMVVNVLPQGETAVREVIESVIQARGPAAGLAALGLLWASLAWFESVDRGINRIWGVARRRPFLKAKLYALAMVAGAGLVSLASWITTAALRLAQALARALPLTVPGELLLWEALAALVSVALMTGVLAVLYRVTPLRPIEWADVLPGALLTALLWELARYMLAFYLTSVANYGAIYGPLAAVIALLFWLYVAHVIVLAGAEFTYEWTKARRGILTGELPPVPDRGWVPTPKFTR
jgi:membrane protein